MSQSPVDSVACASAGLEHLLLAARAGSTAALGKLLEGCRHYLLVIAQEEIEPDLQAKGGASDLVQDTFLEAQAAFARFDGSTERQLLAWLRQILLHNLADFRRRYLRTDQRQLGREVSLDDGSQFHALLPAGLMSLCSQAIQREQIDALLSALEGFPEHYRQVIEWRHREHLSFPEIGLRLNRSPDAVRMLWARALEQLAEKLDSSG